MYFVTTKREGYVLFCLTPSERAALGLTEKRLVHLLVRQGSTDWVVLCEWEASEFSHTDFLAALHRVEEPADPKRLLDFLPARLRQRAAT
jgi:hypothetical protein